MSLTSRAQEEPPSCWNLGGGAKEENNRGRRGGGAVECVGDVTAAGGILSNRDIILRTQAPPTNYQA